MRRVIGYEKNHVDYADASSGRIRTDLRDDGPAASSGL